VALPLWAEEGMWLPHLLKSLNESRMKSLGMRISAEDIYSVNKSSLKDAVVSFGGFCTGEIISSDGLLLTNHHCGLGQLQRHASVENDYITNGYWAMQRDEELPNPGLSVTIIKRIEDVTTAILQGTEGLKPQEVEAKIRLNSKELEKKAVEGSHYKAFIRSFAYGNEYYLFVTEVFEDVRLVGAPPKGIGNFGGDTDNWIWPRHNADFMLFRIYAGKDNMPAAYSKDNVPYKPVHHLPVSLKGVKEGDFSMVMGFPGRTQEYLTSHALRLTIEQTNPHNIAIRTARLQVMEQAMKKSDKVRIQYVSKYAGVSNAWKKWQGESRGLRRADAVLRKEQQEAVFANWVAADANRVKTYGKILPTLSKAYDSLRSVNIAANMYREALSAPEIVRVAQQFASLLNMQKPDKEKAAMNVANWAAEYFKNYDQRLDQTLWEVSIAYYRSHVPASFWFPELSSIDQKFKGSVQAHAEKIFLKSAMTTPQGVDRLLSLWKSNKTDLIQKDPVMVWYTQMTNAYQTHVVPTLTWSQTEIETQQAIYIRALREMQPEKAFYPDANSTLRVTYGKVEGYFPRDGVRNLPYTTSEGIVDKAATGEEDYEMPGRLGELIKRKEFGKYADASGQLPVCFIASNHTTGGNSGSPVLNADGHLVGTNFDRNWEGTMSDLYYDPSQSRNIAVDIRYTLFIVDKYAGAGYLLKEMTLIE
jgi:hypothetical protein